MAEHERTRHEERTDPAPHTAPHTAPRTAHQAAPDTTPDTDQIPAQTWPTAPSSERTPEGTPARSSERTPEAPVDRAYRKARRSSASWVRLAVAVVVLIVLLVFILENLQTASITFFGAHLQLPLGVALLLAAILGIVIVLVPSFSRITQLRRTLRRATSGK
ncbi:MAG TPA: lipopolysaccharide assembly protein LapA domain-containing protein [Pseudonocardiaceae bacterium]|nr:lipopolysaccharide assembly protein LapA domain-containing protein [Pseudonocardiaceae bacterium]